jgi:hypothetical protein
LINEPSQVGASKTPVHLFGWGFLFCGAAAIRPGEPRGETYTSQMNTTSVAWEARLADLWKRLDATPAANFQDAMRQLTAELPEGHAVALFEMGSALDSTGSP